MQHIYIRNIWICDREGQGEGSVQVYNVLDRWAMERCKRCRIGNTGVSEGTVERFNGIELYHPLPFASGSRLKFLLPFMEEPVYGTLESELDWIERA